MARENDDATGASIGGSRPGLDELACQALLGATAGYVFRLDTAKRIRYLNRAPLGRAISEYLSNDVVDFAIPSHRTIVSDAIERVASGASSAEIEFQGAETGHWYWMRVAGIRQQGIVTGFAVHCLDIETAKRYERELQALRGRARAETAAALGASELESESETRRFELMADALPVLISYVDDDRRYQYNNAAYERWFGTRRDEIRGRRVVDVLGEAAHERVRPYVDAALAGTSVTFEAAVPYKNAGLRQVIARYVPDIAPGGHVDGFFALIEDVTSRREAEDALRQRDDELRQLQKMEALGRLAGGLAHDFNNLLQTIVVGSAAAIRAAGGNERVVRPIESVRSAAQRGVAMTRQLLSFSRPGEREVRAVDMGELIEGIASLLGRLLDAKIALRVHTESGYTFADSGELQQVVMNLVINARDAMPAGGVLSIETRREEVTAAHAASHPHIEPGSYVLLRVSDTGVGMDDATAARIFEPFFTTKEASKGTGLGLTNVYGIVRRAGGHIDVESAPGKGSTFHLYFPACEESPGGSHP